MDKQLKNCAEIRNYFSEYIDHEASPDVCRMIESHISECESCRQELEEMKRFSGAFSEMELEALPAGFKESFHEKLEQEQQIKPKKRRSFMKVASLCACFFLVVGLVGLGGGLTGAFKMGASAEQAAGAAEAPMAYASENTMSYDMAMPEEAIEESIEMEAGAAAYDLMKLEENGTVTEQEYERKIIKNYYLSLRVDDFEEAYNTICALAGEYGGYVVSGNIYNYDDNYRDGYLSIRVDSSISEEAVAAISELGKVENNNMTTDDVTTEYYDTQSRLAVYEAQRDRLLEMYDKAETINDMLMLESQLADTIANLESLEGMMKYYDQMTSLSLIEINLYCPSTYEQTVEPKGWEGFSERVGQRFLSGVNNLLDGLADMVYWFARALPTLILIVILVGIGYLVIRRIIKKRNK